jgi:hypothetical protein
VTINLGFPHTQKASFVQGSASPSRHALTFEVIRDHPFHVLHPVRRLEAL